MDAPFPRLRELLSSPEFIETAELGSLLFEWPEPETQETAISYAISHLTLAANIDQFPTYSIGPYKAFGVFSGRLYPMEHDVQYLALDQDGSWCVICCHEDLPIHPSSNEASLPSFANTGLTMAPMGRQDRFDYIPISWCDGVTLHHLLRAWSATTLTKRIALTAALGAIVAERLAKILCEDDVPALRYFSDEHIYLNDKGDCALFPSWSTERMREHPYIIPGYDSFCKLYSPEHLMEEKTNIRTNLFSLGLLLYRFLSQKPVFQGIGDIQTIHAILREGPPTLPPQVPTALQQLLKQMLAKNKDDRPDVGEIVAVCGALLHALQGQEPNSFLAQEIKPLHAIQQAGLWYALACPLPEKPYSRLEGSVRLRRLPTHLYLRRFPTPNLTMGQADFEYVSHDDTQHNESFVSWLRRKL